MPKARLMGWIANFLVEEKCRSSIWRENTSLTEKPFFWELGFSPDQDDFLKSKDDISSAILGRASLSSYAVRLGLFYLIKTRLTDISMGQIWVSVARELNPDDNTGLTANKCGQYFRNILNQTDGSRIPKDSHKNYVAWCIFQTNTGSDRKTIMDGFLRLVIQKTPSTDTDSGKLAKELYEDYCAQERLRGNKDIPYYRLHMEYTAGIVIKLIRELIKGNILCELILWDWEELTQWWLRESGTDLKRLTNETREALNEILHDGSLILPRDILINRYSMIAQNELEYLSPSNPTQWVKLVPDSDPDLGPIELRINQTKRAMLLADGKNITGDRIIEEFREGITNDVGGGKCLVWFDPSGSVVQLLSDSVRSSLRKFYTGDSVKWAKCRGLYWLGRTTNSFVRKLDECGVENTLPAECKIKWVFKFDKKNGISISIRDIDLRLPAGVGKVILWINGQKEKEWHPTDEGRLLPSPVNVFSKSPESAFKIQIEDDDHSEILHEEKHENPLACGLVVAVDGKITEEEILHCNFDSCFNSGNPEKLGFVVITRVSDEMNFRSCTHEIVGLLYGESYIIYQIRPNDAGQFFFSFSAGDREWLVFCRAPLSISGGNRALSYKGVDITGESKMIPVIGSSDLAVSIPKQIIEAVPDLKLVAGLLGKSERWMLNQLMGKSRVENGIHFIDYNISPLIDQAVAWSECALLTIHLGSSRKMASERLPLYLVPEEFDTQETELGGTASIRVRGLETAKMIKIRSVGTLPQQTELPIPKTKAWLTHRKYGGISFEWSPPLNDAVIIDGTGKCLIGDDLDLASLSNHAAIHPLWEKPGDWDIRIDDKVASRESHLNDIKIEPLIKGHLIGMLEESRTHLNVSVHRHDMEMPVRQWGLDIRIRINDLSCDWMHDNGLLKLRVDWNQISFAGIHSTIEIDGDGGIVLFRQKNDEASESFEEVPIHRKINFEEMLVSLVRPESPGALLIRQGNEILKQTELPGIEIKNKHSLDRTRKEILKLIVLLGNPGFYAGHKVHWLVVLVERYMRDHDDFPIPNLDGLLSQLSQNEHDLIELQAMECLRTLQYLQKDNYRTPTTDLFEKEGRLQLMLLSLHVAGQYRMYRKGMANPEMIENLAIIINNRIDSPGKCESTRLWLPLMLKLCRHMKGLGRNQSEYMQSPERILLGFDDGINQWLEEQN